MLGSISTCLIKKMSADSAKIISEMEVLFSCFALSELFSAVPRASGLVFMFCATVLVFNGTKGAVSHLHVLRSWTRFGRYRGRRVEFSCFALSDSFSTVSRASGPVLMFFALRLIFNGTGGVGSRFLILRFRTCFRRYHGRQVPFSYFALLGTILGNTEGVGSSFHVLRSRTLFRRYLGRRVPFSCFALRDSFFTLPRTSDPFFMYYAPKLTFGGTKGILSSFYVLRSETRFGRNRGRRVPI
jgi:hypothetical protein